VGVSISGLVFKPPSVHVAIGGTVTVTNNDGTNHTWTADAGQTDSWDSGDLTRGGAFTHLFGTVGTFRYHCTLHPFMTGNVVVG
jgi:plastocyanin